jgi:ATP-dependent Clp protease ATP-binding subunit ClpB
MAFRFEKLTIKAQEAVARSQELAAEAGNPQIEPVHLLAALLDEQGGIVRPVLDKIGANTTQLEQIVESELKHLPKPAAARRRARALPCRKSSMPRRPKPTA